MDRRRVAFTSMFRGVAIAVSAIVFVSRASFADVVAGPRSSVAIRVSVAALVGEVASDAAAVDVSAVDSVRGGDGVGGMCEGDEGAPARAAGVVVEDDLHRQHLAVALENSTHGALVGVENRSPPTNTAEVVAWVAAAPAAPAAPADPGLPREVSRGGSDAQINAKGVEREPSSRASTSISSSASHPRDPRPRPNGRLESAAPRDVDSVGAEIQRRDFLSRAFRRRRRFLVSATDLTKR